MMSAHPDFLATRYRDLAAYNVWANSRLYAAAAKLDDGQFHEDRGAFFGSICGTLNHLLVADRIWMRRFTGEGPTYTQLDLVLFGTLPALAQAREAEDGRIRAFIEHLPTGELTVDLSYTNTAGIRFTQPLAATLDHFFNHQTHHRGQAHALISAFLGGAAAPSLDLLMFQRESGRAATESS